MKKTISKILLIFCLSLMCSLAFGQTTIVAIKTYTQYLNQYRNSDTLHINKLFGNTLVKVYGKMIINDYKMPLHKGASGKVLTMASTGDSATWMYITTTDTSHYSLNSALLQGIDTNDIFSHDYWNLNGNVLSPNIMTYYVQTDSVKVNTYLAIGDSSDITEETDTLRISSAKNIKIGNHSLLVKRNGGTVVGELTVNGNALINGKFTLKNYSFPRNIGGAGRVLRMAATGDSIEWATSGINVDTADYAFLSANSNYLQGLDTNAIFNHILDTVIYALNSGLLQGLDTNAIFSHIPDSVIHSIYSDSAKYALNSALLQGLDTNAIFNKDLWESTLGYIHPKNLFSFDVTQNCFSLGNVKKLPIIDTNYFVGIQYKAPLGLFSQGIDSSITSGTTVRFINNSYISTDSVTQTSYTQTEDVIAMGVLSGKTTPTGSVMSIDTNKVDVLVTNKNRESLLSFVDLSYLGFLKLAAFQKTNRSRRIGIDTLVNYICGYTSYPSEIVSMSVSKITPSYVSIYTSAVGADTNRAALTRSNSIQSSYVSTTDNGVDMGVVHDTVHSIELKLDGTMTAYININKKSVITVDSTSIDIYRDMVVNRNIINGNLINKDTIWISYDSTNIYNFPDSSVGWAEIYVDSVGYMVDFANVTWSINGNVHLLSNSSHFIGTNSNGFHCFYDSGSYAVLRDRRNATYNYSIKYHYHF